MFRSFASQVSDRKNTDSSDGLLKQIDEFLENGYNIINYISGICGDEVYK
jgi:uncharacterized protein (UPF0297 family)